MAGKPTKVGNAFKLPKPSVKGPKPKMTYNKRLLTKMKTRLKRSP